MAKARLNSRGQLTLPPEVREHLHLESGSEVVIRVLDDHRIELRAGGGSLADLAASISVKRHASLEDFEEGIRRGATQ